MLVSRCCKQGLYVEGHITHYYVCGFCNRACDTIFFSEQKGIKDEPKYDRKVETITDSS